jgi:sugar lactone lactonase YvrE
MDLEVFDERRCTLGEGPTSSRLANSHIMWVDILGKKLYSKNASSGETTEQSSTEEIGFALPGEDSGVVLGYASGAKFVASDGRESSLPHWQTISPDDPATPVRWNDAKVSPHQQLYAGTMAFDATPGAGGLYRISPDGKAIDELVPNVSVSNGLDWSPDQSRFYHIDTLAYELAVYDYSEEGISNRATLISFDQGDALPDGMCVDAEGGLWVAFFNGQCVKRYDSDGKLSHSIDMPVRNITSCAFGGPDLDHLFITTAAFNDEENSQSGMTFVVKPGVTGQPLTLYPNPLG